MKRQLMIVAFILLACALLSGCGGTTPPEPSLESPDRNERLEAVRNAQNRYGAYPAQEIEIDGIGGGIGGGGITGLGGLPPGAMETRGNRKFKGVRP